MAKRAPIVRFLRRVETPLGPGRQVALRRGRLAQGGRLYRIEATSEGVTEAMNLTRPAMAAIAAAFATLEAEAL